MAVKKAKKSVAAKVVVEKQGVTAVEEKPKRAVKAEAPSAYVVIDHPVENETVSGLHYAIRIGASEGNVELSIDGGEWQPARNAAGYWWFDWGYFAPGSHKIAARLINETGKVVKKSIIRKVQVI